MMRTVLFLQLAAMAASLGLPLPAQAQPQHTVLDGVFDSSQARRGARTYRNICAECHEGSEPDGDPLTGPVFVERWREAPLSFLYDFISTEMPGNDAGSLNEQSNLEVVAYLLSVNDYPAGDTLSHAQLDDILLVDATGPRPLPLYSLIRLVGCLQPGSDANWQLQHATAMARVRTADESNASELAASQAAALGNAAYYLRNTDDFDTATTSGYKVQVKGVLAAHGDTPTVTVLSLDNLAEECPRHD